MKKIKRIFHTYDKWECFPCGFYENKKEGMTKNECELEYKNLLTNEIEFRASLYKVITEWKYSCEHYLTNEKMNRIAWLGQASLCISKNIPSCFRSGYFLLSSDDRIKADNIALEYLNYWLSKNGYEQTTLEGAGVNSQANIY